MSKSIDLDFPVHRPMIRAFSENLNSLVSKPDIMGDEIIPDSEKNRQYTAYSTGQSESCNKCNSHLTVT
ncbi:hypothetical protein HAX54_003396, partial [Datura stramonium]|nr:hypothetical protein [Datura stramonium]